MGCRRRVRRRGGRAARRHAHRVGRLGMGALTSTCRSASPQRCSRRACCPSRATTGARHFDIAGAVSVTAGLSLLVYSLVNANEAGWTLERDARADRPRARAARRLRADRAAHQGAAGAVPGHLPPPLDRRREHHRAAGGDVAVLDVLLHLALHAAGARLRSARDRPRLPAAGGRHHRLGGHRLDPGHADGRPAGADRRPAADRDRPAVVLADLRRRQLRQRRPVPVADQRPSGSDSRSCR